MAEVDGPARVLATAAAVEWIGRLTATHGPVLFHQSGGCCDGSVPMCYPRGEFRIGAGDVLLGHVADDVPVWIGVEQFEYWRYSEVTIDLVPGRGSGMSLDGGTGMRFVSQSRIFSESEVAALALAGEPPRGA